MFLRRHARCNDGKDHTYWSLVETVRTPDGPRQRTLCYLGELNGSAQARWLKTVEVFNEQGETQQLKLFPSDVEPPADDPQVARVLLNKVRLVSAARALRECVARKASRTRSNTTKDNVRKQCATARKTDERDMNAQDCTLQNATGARFRLGRSFCGAQVYFTLN